VSRTVDGRILSLLDEAQETARLYIQLESERGRLVFEFGLLYLGFAVILILAAIWLGLWFAERLSRPVGRLAGAAQRVGAGDLDVQVMEEEGDDEIAMLGRLFNQMTRQLKGQREALLDTNRQIERRRRLFDSVLSSVTRASSASTSRPHHLRQPRGRTHPARGRHRRPRLPLAVAIPEFEPLLQKLAATRAEAVQEELRITRAGKVENLLVRIAPRRAADGRLEGYVVAFDDVTDLVSAQRMAAWGDVARRIAHEIKNPLTPIQLSAERIRRKFAGRLGDDAAALEQYTEVIVRQTGDLRRIVDEFSKFARMPEPERTPQDLVRLVRDASCCRKRRWATHGSSTTCHKATPRRPRRHDDRAGADQPPQERGRGDRSLQEKGGARGPCPHGRGAALHARRRRVIAISDNGIGLPEDRARLFEPYVTTREKGTGLGLPIVKKIIEEHGGTLVLTDAAPLDDTGHRGARAEVTLPLAHPAKSRKRKNRPGKEAWHDRHSDRGRRTRHPGADLGYPEGRRLRDAHRRQLRRLHGRDQRGPPALMILDIWLKDSRMDGIDILKTVRRDNPDVPVVIISGHGNIEIAVAAIKQGAYDFIEKPFNIDQLMVVIGRAMETARLRRENTALRRRDVAAAVMIGSSPSFRACAPSSTRSRARTAA
jgi:two-component system, NtrC family, nitrogen regulation sensor histidine kinase NtrY